MISYRVCCTKSFWRISERSGWRSPYSRMRAGSPARKCRSEPFFSSTCFRYSSMTGTCRSGSAAAARGLLRRAGDLELGHERGVGDVTLEWAAVTGVRDRIVRIDFLGRERLEQGLVHELHARSEERRVG